MDKEEKELSINDKTSEIYKFIKKLDETPPKRSFKDIVTGKNKPKKTFKLSYKIRAGWKTKLKKNYVLVLRVRTNGELVIHFAPINNEMIYVQDAGTYHVSNAEYMLRYGKYPAIILPEWSLKPFSPSEHFKKTEQEGAEALHQRVIIKAMKMADIKQQGMMKGKTLLWVLILGVAALYIISQILGK
jgi:hypothetical protein